MFKQVLKQQQSVVYKTLENALLHNKLAHAYLFNGPVGTPMLETTYLLAQSLICEEEGYACEICDECQRIQHNNYADLMYIDGRDTSIKKGDILGLQHEFNKTGLEKYGRKVYIIDGVEHATPDALNSLLKFLEEPSGDMTAILLTHQIDAVLPTIVSRCQLISFTALTSTLCFDKTKEELPLLHAYLLSIMIRNVEHIKEVSDSDDFQHSLYLFKGFIDNYIQTPYRSLLFLQMEGPKNKQKKLDKRCTEYVLDMLSIYFKDCMYAESVIEDTWYYDKVMEMRKQPVHYIEVLDILMKTRDKLLKSVNINLLLDQMVYEMKEVTK